jgi:hypothetical protein
MNTSYLRNKEDIDKLFIQDEKNKSGQIAFDVNKNIKEIKDRKITSSLLK